MISTFLLKEMVFAKERFGQGVPEVVFLLFPIVVLEILQIKPGFRKQ